ncbi:MAG TPA: serine/threonine-protein kinase [Gemmatimonadales bacterium]|jgi:serine/threonine-protein kinase|nr:serine/threonine-protein kinase [Gemmatimonadales bacterium]
MVSPSLQQQLQTSLGDAYRLERELGGGGMSRVFVAQELALGREVVVKVLLPELAAGVSVSRFRREIQLAARLQHPHIVPLLAAGESDGLPYFIMPFVVGESLRGRVAREGELPVGESVRILRDVVSALAYAHSAGIMHRDIKPDNVLLSGGVAVVTDFGVAKAVSVSAEGQETAGLTSLGVALGTPAYMAPEQATGDPQIDHRADIYSLGAMAYEMLTGRPPFMGRSAQAVLAAQVVEMPEPVERLRPAVPSALATLVASCLAKRPADRPQSAHEVMNLLDTLATPSGGMAPTLATTVPTIAAVPPRRRRAVLAGAAATCVLLLLLAATLWLRPSPPPRGSAAPITPTKAETTAMAPQPAQPAVPPPAAPRATEPTVPVRTMETKPPRKRQPAVAPQPREAVPEPAESAAPSPASAPAVVVAPAAPAPAQDTVESVTPSPRPAPAPTPPPPVDPRPEIRRVVADYAAAIESRNIASIRRVYPGMTPVQERGWDQFFQLVREVKAQLDVSQLETAGGNAMARITGNYTYRNGSTGRTERQPVSFQAILHRTDAGWRIGEVR